MKGGDGRAIVDQDRRYWRRRANRQVRKARRLRTLLRGSGMFAANVAIVAFLAFSGFRAARHLIATPEFALRTIQVEGTHHTSPEAIRARLAPLVGQNLLELRLETVAARVESDPWVREASVKRVLPHALRIQVVERTPAALAVIRGLAHVVDSLGFVIGPAGPGLSYDVPVITGLDRLSGEDLREALRTGVRVVARLRETLPSWEATLSEIDLGSPDRVAIVTREPGPTILLDRERVERNVEDYLALRAEIEKRVGAVQTVDLRWSHRISVIPAAATSLPENH